MRKLIFFAALSIIVLLLSIIVKNTNLNYKSNAARIIPVYAKIGFMGDLNIGRTINYVAQKNSDYNLFDYSMSAYLKINDLNVANLESTILGKNPKTGINPCPVESERRLMIFCGDPKFVPYFKTNKFIFTLANNHIDDFNINRLDAKKLTMDTLNSYGVPFYSVHESNSEFVMREINDIKFGFIGVDLINHYGGFNTQSKKKILELIKKYDSKVDWLILSIHWGSEYDTKQSKDQIEFAHAFIDTGVDVIHGHHPHVLQPIEYYKSKLIFYSLGNFVFDQNFSKETNTSAIYRLTFSKDKILTANRSSIEITDDGKPHLQYNERFRNGVIRKY